MGRKSKADERKYEILVQFYEVVKDEGFENASIAKIAERMHVNPSLLIHYFKTKEEMVVDLVDFLLVRYEEAYLEKFENIKDPKLRFEMTLNFILGEDWIQMADYHTVFYACYYLASRHERINDRFRQMYKQYREMLESEAKVWFEKGLITNSEPTQVAEYLIMLNEGITFYEGILQNRESFLKRSKWLREMTIKTLTT
jgi:AcrR family transcriptional regulator